MSYFVSIKLPRELQNELDSVLPDNPSLKKVKTNQIHLTLRFIGRMNDEKLSQLKRDLSSVEFNRFQLQLDGIGFFPQVKPPKVIWVGVEESPELNDLQSRVNKIVTRVTEMEADHPFNPHITLARIKKPGVSRQDVISLTESLPAGGTFEVGQFFLVKSERDNHGAVHRTIRKYEAK